MTEKKLDSETFLKMVSRSGVADPKKLSRLVEKIRAKLDGRLPDDPKKFAKLLTKEELLTAWHVEKLLAGKYKGFFLGKYKLLGHIGTGGMSSVYLAEHTRMGDRRAIKVLPKSRVSDSTYLARFQLEAKAIASLSHENIVLAYDIDNEGDIHYIVMEYINGMDLQQLVKRDGAFDFSTAADVIAQAARGLSHAHGKGVIHRDVKPANLLIDDVGVVKLLDMGLAMVDSDEESLTVVNNENVLGTADYLAPEQALNSHLVDHRADIYGLGCTLYYLLTAKPPFSDGTLAQRIAKHQTEMPTSIRQIRSSCPGELEGICIKMIQKDPRYRYQSASDVAEVLEKFVAKVPKGAKVTTGLGELPLFEDDSSSISLDNPNRTSDPHGDTITNKNDETLTNAKSRAIRKQGISSSDSGRLVAVKRRPDVVEGSFLDLQLESGYRPNSSLGNGAKRPLPSGSSSGQHSGQSSVRVGDNSDVLRWQDSPSGRPPSNPRQNKGIDPMLMAALMLALTIVAVCVGFFIARATS